MKKLSLLFSLLALIAMTHSVAAAPLSIKVYNADENSFHVNSTLVYGESEAAVIDTGFTKADALRIAANVLDSGKTLTTIFVSQADPDYYFGAEVLQQFFPEAKVIATPAVREVIKEKMAGKVAYWGPKMGNNAPKNPVLPAAYQQTSFTIDGETIEIKGTTGLLAHRPYLWIPTSKTIVGNVAIFGGLHVWTADIQQSKPWSAWLDQLTEMNGLLPNVVVPGHMKADTELTATNIDYTVKYLKAFNHAKSTSKNASILVNKMSALYPQAQLPIALNIGAKVHKGEMAW